MDTIYQWLIKNTGNAHLPDNEGQFLTILNVQREKTHDGIEELDVMVRNQDFHVMNLLICPGESTAPEAPELQGRNVVDTYSFATEEDLITYLSEGKTPDTSTRDGFAQYRVLVLEPTEAAGEVTFPPAPEGESAGRNQEK